MLAVKHEHLFQNMSISMITFYPMRWARQMLLSQAKEDLEHGSLLHALCSFGKRHCEHQPVKQKGLLLSRSSCSWWLILLC